MKFKTTLLVKHYNESRIFTIVKAVFLLQKQQHTQTLKNHNFKII